MTMRLKLHLSLWTLVSALVLLGGCANTPSKPYDYAAFRESNPKSILVLPPLNMTPEVRATYSMLAQVTRPLAESGYYVTPVTLVDETFKENGLTQPEDMHALPAEKLRDIFGADAALYIKVTRYGTVFQVVNSVTTVSAEARLVDLRTGQQLWSGSASANSEEGKNQQQQGGLASLLISAVLNQVVSTATDASHPIAGRTSARLLMAGQSNGLLFGARSAKYGKE